MTSSATKLHRWDNIYTEFKKNQQIWDLFTKKDEYNPKKLDKYGRPTFKTSNQENILVPWVSEYLNKTGFQPEYIDGKKFTIFLSHDVDDIDISGRHIFRSFIPYPFHRHKLGFKKFVSAYFKKQKPFINFKEIFKIEKKYNATSSFFFLATERDVFGHKYKLDDILNEISYISENECEIGLHTGFYSFDDINQIKQEKKKLEDVAGTKIIGVRNHLFRFTIPRSWKLLSLAGFEYASSLGYSDMIGFRNGICYPFKPYDLVENKKIDIIEIPPCVADIAMFSYMNINAYKAWEYIQNLIDTVEQLGGVLTILWHNWTFSYPVSYSGLFGKEWTKLYEKILEYGHKKNAWLTNGKNISDFISKTWI
ncbi:MAG: polysaccharide deacetylase family protein [Thermoplasmatales archaeon]|nr:MAG: polysaccharide deacetylase family protein [Thermoplasmatales archaeon]